MLALSALYEGFARGLVSLHTPPLLGRKPSSVKSRVSIRSKLIEIKGLQLQYFGHLRKTGGRGSYRLVHATHHPVQKSPPLIPAFPILARPLPNLAIFNILQTIGGRGPGHTRFLAAIDSPSSHARHSPLPKSEKRRSWRLKSPACELGWEKDLGEVLFAGIAPDLKPRPPEDEEKDRRVDGEEAVVTSSGDSFLFRA
jgi:hypothetical protein